MGRIFVDGRPYDVDGEQNLLHACLSAGLDVPYFCWHPALGSVGACRQCAVKQFKDEQDTAGRLVMACMTPASDGSRISIDDPEAKDFRARVIEWLMVNHPHDCPVCDEGGECHLQDMTVMTGHSYRRYRFEKRTHRNQYLGPFINHEMNRCIACYRCVRFYNDYAGGRDLHALAAHDWVYFGRHTDGVLESEFSGNLVEVCPTGVFTDKTLKAHYTRKWDLQSAPSLCIHCSLGCNTIAAERYGELRRILNRYHFDVNGYFLCDRGRFGYEFVNSPRRVRAPALRARRGEPAGPCSREEALRRLRQYLEEPSTVIGIGSPRASLEANYALRELVGPDRFFLGIPEAEARLMELMLEVMRAGPARLPSLREIEEADAVLVLGEDVSNVAPRMALALRQSVRQRPLERARQLGIPLWHDAAVRNALQHENGALYLATPSATRLDDVATVTFHAAPDDLARLGFAVAHELARGSPEVPELGAGRELARRIAQGLREAQRPLVISGPSCGSDRLIQAATNVANALCASGRRASLSFVMPECNSLGLCLLGGGRLETALQMVMDGEAETIIILENDLYRRIDRSSLDSALARARQVVAIDSVRTETVEKADLVLPAGTFAESDGTLVNQEGRAQRFFQVFPAAGDVQESWRWLREARPALDREDGANWSSLDDMTAAVAASVPTLGRITEAAPSARFRIAGQRIARQPHRYSGRTAMASQVSVHEAPPPPDPDTPLAFSMEGITWRQPAAVLPYIWAPRWNSVQALNKFQREVGGPLAGGDPGVRLIEPAEATEVSYFRDVPSPFRRRADEWLIVPLHHIFGSDELSLLGPAIAERAPAPYLALNPEDAAALGAKAGDDTQVVVGGEAHCLPVVLQEALPRGMAGLPAHTPSLRGILLPAWGRLSR